MTASPGFPTTGAMMAQPITGIARGATQKPFQLKYIVVAPRFLLLIGRTLRAATPATRWHKRRMRSDGLPPRHQPPVKVGGHKSRDRKHQHQRIGGPAFEEGEEAFSGRSGVRPA